MSELWDNPLFSMEDRLEMCAGSVVFWKKCYAHQFKQRTDLEEKIKQLEADLYYARQKIEKLEYKQYLQNWQDNPDRMGS